MSSENVDRILTVIQQIPRGKVATYGQVARIAGIPRNSRQVGSVLKNLPPRSDIPWYRVVNSRGEISLRDNLQSQSYQRTALENEGIQFNGQGRLSLTTYGWEM